MFEPVWNRNHIDHVQIDIPETLSIEMRGSFYEETGAFRDMIVTHLFQVLGFVAMEPPTSLEPKPLGLEREKVFDSMPPLRPEDVVRGQYAGYREEDGVAADSDTETFVAVKAFVDNWRWEGVPFYLRSGKRLAESRHLLTVAFTRAAAAHVPARLRADRRVLRPRPPHLRARRPRQHLGLLPGQGARARRSQLGEAHMRFSYADSFGGPEQALDAYERLIHDVMVGDRTLFTSSDRDRAPLGDLRAGARAAAAASSPTSRAPGGPEAIDALIAPRRWHLPSDHV